jgi:uncharacterized protein (TIGR02594 family)
MAATPWFDVATKFVGTKEYPGNPNNPAIMNWAKRVGRFLGIRYDGDHVPWCGLFIAYCTIEAGLTPPSVAVRASEWAKWGVPLRQGARGAVLVFTRDGGGHVGLYHSEDATHYHVLGGNQSDMVNVTKIAKTRCSAIRWPAGVPLPTGGPIKMAFAGPVSVNEA